MTCEEFAAVGLDLDPSGADEALQQAARDHLRECPQCAALQANWLALRVDLRALGTETAEANAPARVEMRLRQEFRTIHKTVKRQRMAFVAGWSLAAAAVLLCAFAWINWRHQRGPVVAHKQSTAVQSAASQRNFGPTVPITTPAGAELGDVLVASSSSGDFTLLPGSLPPAPEDATVVRVQMQRAALGALGLTVNEEHAGDWIQVDLLIGDDGLPQAVRLPPASTQTSN